MSNFSEAQIKSVAKQSWWLKARSKKELAAAHNLTADQIDDLRATREYKEYVLNLLVRQVHTLKAFNEWFKDPGKFGRIMGLKPEDVEDLFERARQAHAEIDSGTAKAQKPIPDPYKRPENHKHTLYREQKRKCKGKKCGKIFEFSDMTIDHIVPRSRGGTDALENLQLLYQSCNSSKGTRTQEEWIAACC